MLHSNGVSGVFHYYSVCFLNDLNFYYQSECCRHVGPGSIDSSRVATGHTNIDLPCWLYLYALTCTLTCESCFLTCDLWLVTEYLCCPDLRLVTCIQGNQMVWLVQDLQVFNKSLTRDPGYTLVVVEHSIEFLSWVGGNNIMCIQIESIELSPPISMISA